RDEPLCRFAIWKHHDVGLTYIGPADRLQLNRGLNTLRMSRAPTIWLSLRHSYAADDSGSEGGFAGSVSFLVRTESRFPSKSCWVRSARESSANSQSNWTWTPVLFCRRRRRRLS